MELENEPAPESDLSGKFFCQFGISSAHDVVFAVMEREGLLHITSSSIFVNGGVIGEAPDTLASYRLDPTRTHGYFDPATGIVALCDSIKPRQWLILHPSSDDHIPDARDAFTQTVAILTAATDGRMEQAPLDRTSKAGVSKAIIGVILTVVLILVVIALKMFGRMLFR